MVFCVVIYGLLLCKTCPFVREYMPFIVFRCSELKQYIKNNIFYLTYINIYLIFAKHIRNSNSNVMKKLYFFFIVLLVSSCAAYNTSSELVKNIALGEDKTEILAKLGAPFRMNIYEEGNVKKDVLIYKERVHVGGFRYIVTSELFFENGKLKKVMQYDKYIPGNVISIDSIHK